ncbi:neprilysin-11-like [Ornithodoros turicata]|uniref:neprilysin-11-like n=1 Tax=Ornithodoros turicata TaxID=34597 RepID=UPI00313974F5
MEYSSVPLAEPADIPEPLVHTSTSSRTGRRLMYYRTIHNGWRIGAAWAFQEDQAPRIALRPGADRCFVVALVRVSLGTVVRLQEEDPGQHLRTAATLAEPQQERASLRQLLPVRLRRLHQYASQEAQNSLLVIQVPPTGPRSAIQKAAAFFQDCISLNEGLYNATVLSHFVESFNLGWPYPRNTSTSHLIEVLVQLAIAWGINPLFDLDLQPVPQRTGRHRWMFHENRYLNLWRQTKKSFPILYVNVEHTYKMFPEFQAGVPLRLYTVLDEADSEVLQLTRVYTSRRKKITFQGMANIIRGIKPHLWVDAINTLTDTTYTVLATDTIVTNVRLLRAVHNLVTEFNDNNPGAVASFLTWHIINALSVLAYNESKSLMLKRGFLQDYCFYRLNHILPLASSRPYMDTNKTSLNRIDAIFKSIQQQYKKRVEKAPWLDSETRTVALSKLDTVTAILSAPDLMKNDTALDSLYACVTDERELDTLSLYLSASDCHRRLIFTKTASIASAKDMFWLTPVSFLAKYEETFNVIVVMKQSFSVPLYSGENLAVDQSGLGMLIGKQMLRTFYRTGSEWDAEGSNHVWWTTATRKTFDRATECVANEFNTDIRDLSFAFADFVMPSVAFAAYEDLLGERGTSFWNWFFRERRSDQFVDDQLFFMNLCFCLCDSSEEIDESDARSAKNRCNLPLRHAWEFSRAFGCVAGDYMHAETTCNML